MNFINTNFIGNGERAYLINSSKDSFCTIFTSYRNSEIPVYVLGSKLLLIPVQNLGRGRKVYLGVSLEEEKLVKSETPQVKLFVMSFCPFGRKALEFMKDVYPLLKDKANIEVHYLISPGNATHCLYGYCSLHGLSEIREDLREICVHKIYGWDKYWKYIACNLERCTMDNIEECWKECANQAGISAEEIENCMETKGREYLSEEFVHIVSGQLLGYGSPTLVINNKKIEGLVYRSAEELKERICEAFITQPEECKTEIGTASSASAISGTCK